ncbi:aldo/keto reductase [Promicromonospora sp. Marseille-Q5078]
MQYRPLGRTDVQVSPLTLGAMMFGPWGNDDRQDAHRVIHRAPDAGINRLMDSHEALKVLVRP